MKDIRINNIRAIAIIIVVLGHSIILYSSSWGYYSSVYSVSFLDNLKKLINVIQMPLFFSLSGYLFYYSTQKFTHVIPFFIKKIKRLIIPFFLVAYFWMIPIKIVVKYSNYIGKNGFLILKDLIMGYDAGHLWYLPTLFIIFIIMYFVCKYISNSTAIYKDVILFVIFALLSVYTDKLFVIPCIQNVFRYFIYFYVGYIIKKYDIDKQNRFKALMTFVSILLLIINTYFYSNVILYLITVIVFLVVIYSIMPNKEYEILNKISSNSFGIYLFHSPLIYFTYSKIPNAHPFIVVFINFVVFGFVAYFLTVFVRNTKFKFIIGE